MADREDGSEFEEFSRENYNEFAEDNVGFNSPPFRGGRGAWRGRGRGHFEGGFNPRGHPRFRGGRGFMPPQGPMRGMRGPNMGFSSRGRFRGPNVNHGQDIWQQESNPFQSMNHHGPGHVDMESDGKMSQVWAETRTPEGKIYYYHTQTRETTWEKPDGANVKVIHHDEWTANKLFMGPKMPFSMGLRGESNPPPFPNTSMPPPFVPGNASSPSAPLVQPPANASPSSVASSLASNPQSAAPASSEAVIEEKASTETVITPKPPTTHSTVSVPPTGPKVSVPAAQVSQPPPGIPPPGFPPFNMPPPSGFSANFAMMPPPWTPLSGVPPPTGVPPPMMPMDPFLSHVDRQVVSKALEWTEHLAPDGKIYYFNRETQASVWEKPRAVLELEAAKIAAQQRLTSQPPPTVANANSLSPSKEKKNDKEINLEKVKEAELKKNAANEKCRPISSTPVIGTPWCVVWTGDKRVFFYNPSTKQSVWERPNDLMCRADVDELVKACPDEKKVIKVKRAEATSTTSPLSDQDKQLLLEQKSTLVSSAADQNDKSEEPVCKKAKTDSKEEVESESLEENASPNDEAQGEKKEDKEKPKLANDLKNSLTQANALEAEVKAAKERATVPMEIRLKQFKEMLNEKKVSAFSTWEKELHKIVFDHRYLLLNSKERKVAFENYVKERAEEERKEKKIRMKQIKDDFMKFMTDINVNTKMSYNEFTQKFGRDERYRMVEKSRDRESYFSEFLTALRRKEKEEKVKRREEARLIFGEILKETVRDYHCKWNEVRKIFESDAKLDALENEEREAMFKSYIRQLKIEIKSKEKRKKREKKEKLKKEKKIKEKDPDGEHDNAFGDEGSVKSAGGDSNQEKLDELSEEEEGCITDESDVDDEGKMQREKKERAELSLREREKEVQRTLASHLRDRDKERELFRHEEAVQEFYALLTDLIRNPEISWKDAKKIIKKDRRWEAISVLSREEMEDIFNQHCGSLSHKKRQRFRDLLNEANVKMNSIWKDIRRKIKEDPRYIKFSNSDRKCEREFELYLKDLASGMKNDFKELLKETKMLSHKTKHQVRESPSVLRDIEALLGKDRRYIQLDCMPEERHRLIVDYLDDLERKGPPPPPTASEPCRRSKIFPEWISVDFSWGDNDCDSLGCTEGEHRYAYPVPSAVYVRQFNECSCDLCTC